MTFKTNSFVLPQSVLSKLKCVLCKQYLSVPKITHDSDGYYCGRCSPKLPQSMEAVAYEIIAGTAQFPCRYDQFGCKKYINFEETLNHEKECECRPITCPATDCHVSVKKTNVLQHFQRVHKQLIESSSKFSISSTERNTFIKKLLTLNGDVFILDMYISLENEFWLALRTFEKRHAQKYYQLEIKSVENSQVFVANQQKIAEVSSKTSLQREDSEFIYLNLETVRTVLKSASFFFEIKLITDDISRIPKNKSVLEELECVVCQEYMIPPIFICKTGHSICFMCVKKINYCPTCRAVYEGTRNFSLEKISENVEYPCKNRLNGCTFIGTAKTIHLHEVQCPLKLLPCPLNLEENCNWEGISDEVYKHCRKTHPRCSTILLKHSIYLLLQPTSYQNCYVLQFEDNIFKLFIKHEDQLVHWSVECVSLGAVEEAKYQFILEFVAPTQRGRSLSVRELCTSAQNRNQYSVTLPYNLLKPFIINDRLIYSIDLQKNE